MQVSILVIVRKIFMKLNFNLSILKGKKNIMHQQFNIILDQKYNLDIEKIHLNLKQFHKQHI